MNDRHIKILQSLANYKFLTYKQMIRLGIGKYTSNLSNDFNFLMKRTKPLASKIPTTPTIPAKHFLTKKGKIFLVDNFDWDGDKIKFLPKIPNRDNQNATHRTAIIDCQISLDLVCENDETDVLFCDAGFDKVGDNPFDKKHKSKTAILLNEKETIKADLVFLLQTVKQKELYFLEVENGDNSKKAFQKCKNYGKAIYFGHANKKYNFPSGYRTLWVFMNERTMKNTLKRLQKEPFYEQLTEYFLFKSLEDVQSGNFFLNWLNIKAQKRKLLYK